MVGQWRLGLEVRNNQNCSLHRVWNMSSKARTEPVTENQPDVETVPSHIWIKTYQRVKILEVEDSKMTEDRAGLLFDDEVQLNLNKLSA